MIDEPLAIVGDSFQQSWVKVVKLLAQKEWEMRNLMVQVKNSEAFDDRLHQQFEEFCRGVGIRGSRHVAYTIFPHDFYTKGKTAVHLFNGYNRRNGLFQRLQRRYGRHGSWGT
jgi:hypothetical protein